METKTSAASKFGGEFTIQEHQSSSENENYIVLGKLNAAWSTLDYCLRLALKRKREISINDSEADKIFEYNHGKLIETLLKEYEENQSVISEVNTVGRREDKEKLYARRNKYIHALWAKDEKGQKVYQKIGGKEWREPIDFSHEDISELICEIEKTAFGIVDRTKPNRVTP